MTNIWNMTDKGSKCFVPALFKHIHLLFSVHSILNDIGSFSIRAKLNTSDMSIKSCYDIVIVFQLKNSVSVHRIWWGANFLSIWFVVFGGDDKP